MLPLQTIAFVVSKGIHGVSTCAETLVTSENPFLLLTVTTICVSRCACVPVSNLLNLYDGVGAVDDNDLHVLNALLSFATEKLTASTGIKTRTCVFNSENNALYAGFFVNNSIVAATC